MAEKIDLEINAKVTGGKDVKQLGDDAKEAAESSKSLRLQIRETTVAMQKLEQQGKATGKEYETLRAKLDNLNDTQDRARFKAGQFEDKLASLPGPLGTIGSGLKTAGDAFATFGKGLTISLGIVGLLVAAFIGIKEALGKTKEGTELLSKATSAFNKIIGPIFALLEKLGTIVLPIVTKGLEAVGSVMNKVAKFFGASDGKINEVTASLEKNNEAAKTLADAEKERLAALDKKKQAAEDADKKREEARKARLQARLDDLQTQDKLDEARLAKEKAIALSFAQTEQEKLNIEKQFAQQSFNQKQKDLKDLQANFAQGSKEFKEYQAQLIALEASYRTEKASFTEKQNEIDKENRKQQFEDEKQSLELRRAEGVVTEEQYQTELLDIRKRYATTNQELTQVEIDRANQAREKKKKDAEEERQIAFSDLQNKISDLDRLNQARNDDFQQDILRLEQKKLFLQTQRDLELKAAENDKVKQLEITKKYGDAEIAIEKQITDSKKAEFDARIAAQNDFLGATASVLGQLSSILGQGTAASKAAALAEIAIQTGVGFANGLRIAQESAKGTGPAAAFAFPIFYATQIAAVLAAVGKAKSILKQVPGGGGGSAGAGVGGGVSAPTAPPPVFAPTSPTALAAPQIASGGTNPTSQLAGTLAQASNRPIKAYVVGTDISSQQALDRRTNAASTFS